MQESNISQSLNNSNHDGLRAQNVSFAYAGSYQSDLEVSEAHARPRTLTLLTGGNASGKTTLALVLCGAIPHLIRGNYTGDVTWNGIPHTKNRISEFTSFVFQEPYLYLQGSTIADERAIIAKNVENRQQILVNQLLHEVPEKGACDAMSVGQQQRLAATSALLRPTQLVILDEALEHMDEIATHNTVELAKSVAEAGKIVIVVGAPDTITARLFGPVADNVWKLESGNILCDDETQDKRANWSFNNRITDENMIQATNLRYGYASGDSLVLDEVSFEIRSGECVGISGANGSGKTTLLLALAGLIKAKFDRILLRGRPASRKTLRKHVRMAFQDPEAQIFASSIREELSFTLRYSGVAKIRMAEVIDSIARRLPFDLDCDPHALSYGQKKLLTVLGTFGVEPWITLLDEPLASLDPSGMEIIREAVQECLEGGGAVILTSHDMAFLQTCTNRLYEMRDGKLHEA